MSFVALSALESPSLFLTGDFQEPRVPERFVDETTHHSPMRQIAAFQKYGSSQN